MAEGTRQETNEHSSQFLRIAGNVTGSFPRCYHSYNRGRIRKSHIYIIIVKRKVRYLKYNYNITQSTLFEIARNISNGEKVYIFIRICSHRSTPRRAMKM